MPEEKLKRWQKVAALAKAKDARSQKLAKKELKKLTEEERACFIVCHVHGPVGVDVVRALPGWGEAKIEKTLAAALKKLGQGGAVPEAGSAA